MTYLPPEVYTQNLHLAAIEIYERQRKGQPIDADFREHIVDQFGVDFEEALLLSEDVIEEER